MVYHYWRKSGCSLGMREVQEYREVFFLVLGFVEKNEDLFLIEA